MLDLKQFCSTDKHRKELHGLFTRGDHTFATNGHVMVRVPRIADVAEQEKPEAERTFAKGFNEVPMASLTVEVTIPKTESTECEVCDGRGTEHDCPDCGCTCDWCDGEGSFDKTKTIYVRVGEVFFNGKYISQLMTLPGMKFEAAPVADRPASFKFDGGDGLLMPVRYIGTDDESVIATVSI